MRPRQVFGQPSYRIASDRVEAWVTEAGGQMAPVSFRLGNRSVQPFHIAPWAEEATGEPPIIQALRGDFFCMPFGGNAQPFGGERYPIHGETANARWELAGGDSHRLDLRLATEVRQGQVSKTVSLREGETAVYVRHRVSASGPMSFGHHAMIHFHTEGLIATSAFAFGQVYPDEFETPARGGYTSLQPGAKFHRLESVPCADGSFADLSRYPAREGFEDLVQIFSEPDLPLAWNAVTFPEEGYVWFSLRDPMVLTGTILWHSNGGRHYAPWSGRHRRVLGIEDVTSYMHDGLARSVAENEANRSGFRTYVELHPERPLDVRVIFGVAAVPPEFGHAQEILPTANGIELTDGTRKVDAAVDLSFLRPNPAL